MRRLLSPASLRLRREQKSLRSHTLLKAPGMSNSLRLQRAGCDMKDAEQHDGERGVRDRDRRRSTSSAGERTEPTAELVQVEGSGLSGPFIRRPVMTVLLTLSIIVAG